MDSLGNVNCGALEWIHTLVVTYASPCWAMQDPSSMRRANRNVLLRCLDRCAILVRD